MYPYYLSDRKFDRVCKALYDDDIIGIAEIYGKKSQFRFGRRCIDDSNPDKTTRVPGYRTHQPSERRHETTRRPEIQTYRPDPRTPEARTQRPNYRTQRPNYEPSSPRYEPTRDEKPDKCNTSIDAIAILRGELMIFKGKYLWRLLRDPSGRSQFAEGKIGQMWRELARYDHIDAAFEMKNGNFAFFIGRKIYIYAGTNLVGISDMSHYGFDHQLKKVDAIFRWSHNNKTFIFSGNNYWK